MCLAILRCNVGSSAGRPMCLPWALARAMPARVRSPIFCASTFASDDITGEQDIAKQFIVGGQVRLSVAVEANTAGGEALQVHDGRHHALAGEPIECPEQHTVEPALVGVLEQGGELLSSGRALPAALLVDVFVSNLVPCTGAPGAHLPKVVLRVLAFVVG